MCDAEEQAQLNILVIPKEWKEGLVNNQWKKSEGLEISFFNVFPRNPSFSMSFSFVFFRKRYKTWRSSSPQNKNKKLFERIRGQIHKCKMWRFGCCVTSTTYFWTGDHFTFFQAYPPPPPPLSPPPCDPGCLFVFWVWGALLCLFTQTETEPYF